MKLIRSRFRLLSFLTLIAFLLTALLCTLSALRAEGVVLPAITSAAREVSIPATASPVPDASAVPEMTTGPDQEYNGFGL